MTRAEGIAEIRAMNLAASNLLDYSLEHTANLEADVLRGYPKAIQEARRRGWTVLEPGLHLAINGKYYMLDHTIIAK